MNVKYYIELFTLNNIILYGYAATTYIPEFDWSIKRLKVKNKININKYTCIIGKVEFEEFKINLKKDTLYLKNNKIDAGLKEVNRILKISEKNSIHIKDDVIHDLSYKTILWSLNKNDLLVRINNVFKNDDFNANIENIDLILKKEVSFGLKRNIEKLGNFEIYDLIEKGTFFSYVSNESIVVEKAIKFEDDVIVNMTYWNDEEVYANKIYILNKSSNKIVVKPDCDVDRIRVVIWNMRSGDILYFDDNYLMGTLHMSTDIIVSQNTVEDQWSTKMKKSSSIFMDRIEELNNVSNYIEETRVCGPEKSKIDRAKEEASEIQKSLKFRRRQKGCFIDKGDNQESEITSLEKIKEYIEYDGVIKCTILDPFFSIFSASKLLSRIEKTNFQLEVIFSLCNEDPDTGGKDDNIITKYKEFINKNRNVLHGNLRLINILSGSKQAFHDRYLIREFKDGHKDGFLLSNSINSMGQFYPFVVAPFEKGVLDGVINYIERIKNNQKYNIEILYDSKEFIKNDLNSKKNCKDEMEIINLYKSVSKLNRTKLDIFEQDFNEERLMNFKKILVDNKKEICEFFMEECCNENLKAFKAISLLMYISNEITEEITNNFERYNLSTEKIQEYIQVILGNDSMSEKNTTYLSLKQKLERLCNNNPITMQDYISVNNVFNHSISSYQVCNKFALSLVELLRKVAPEKLLRLIVDIKSPLVYTEFIFYLYTHWNESIFKELLKCKVTSFKELGFCYAYRHIKELNDEEKIEKINKIISIIDLSEKTEFLAFVLAMISQEYDSEKSDKIKKYILKELIDNLHENSNMKRVLFLINTNNKKTIFNLYDILMKITNNNLQIEICREIIRLVKDEYSNKHRTFGNINEISKALWIGANSKLLLKNSILTAKDLSEDLINNNYRILGNPYLNEIDYEKWNEASVNFIINYIYKSYLIDQYEGDDKVFLLNSIIDELYIGMIGLSQIHNESSIIGFMLIIYILAEWVRLGYVDKEKKNKIYNVSPDWVKFILLLNETTFNKNELCKLIENNYTFDNSTYCNGEFIITGTLGEYIVLKEITEEDSQVKKEIKKLREKFINKYLDSSSYKEYLDLLVSGEDINNIEWKERGFGFSRIQELKSTK